MATLPKETPVYERKIPLADFLKSYNQTIPAAFPKATGALLQKFKDAHEALFKSGDLWSLDLHRKKVMDWLPGNSKDS